MSMTSGYPKCTITIYNKKGYYQTEEEVKGKITIEAPVEG